MTDKRGVTSQEWTDLAAKYLVKYCECLAMATALNLAENGDKGRLEKLLIDRATDRGEVPLMPMEPGERVIHKDECPKGKAKFELVNKAEYDA